MPDQILDETFVHTKPKEDEPQNFPSPFLPDTKIQYAWDSTSLGMIKTCPRLYQYTMIDGWTPKGESVHLRFGQEYHTALEQYDISRSNGVKHEDAIHDVIHELLIRTEDYHPDPETKAGKYKSKENLLQLVIDYLDHFAEDPAQTYIKADGTPAVELSFRFELGWGPKIQYEGEGGQSVTEPPLQPYLLCGHLDRVVDFNNQLLVMDRKTSSMTLGPYYFKQYEPNNQMTLYTIAGKVVMDSPIKGVIIDAAQIMLTEPNRFVRGFTYRTEDQLDEWLNDLAIILDQAEAYAQADYWPMNDTSCDKFGGCRFRDICSKSTGVRETFLKADFEKKSPDQRWNPLRSR